MEYEQAKRVLDAATAAAGATMALFECGAAHEAGDASKGDVIDVVTDYLEKQRSFENARNSQGVL